MSKQAINTYYNKLEKSIRYGGTSKENTNTAILKWTEKEKLKTYLN